jgi:hypothetical protein
MRTSAHGVTILMRQFSFEWDYGAGRMAFPIPVRLGFFFISSPELKAQVSFSDRPLSGVRLSVRLSVRL